jgi:hypothetical protein
LTGTSTGDVLWVDEDVTKGACEVGEGRGSSTTREGMGGDGEENAGMVKVVEVERKDDMFRGFAAEGEFRKRKKMQRGDYGFQPHQDHYRTKRRGSRRASDVLHVPSAKLGKPLSGCELPVPANEKATRTHASPNAGPSYEKSTQEGYGDSDLSCCKIGRRSNQRRIQAHKLSDTHKRLLYHFHQLFTRKNALPQILPQLWIFHAV